MADFAGEGFAPFPSLYSDSKEVLKVTEWSDEVHNRKTAEYRVFLRTPNLMPRARATAEYILTRLEFEADCRDKEVETFMNELETL